ncbi:MAG: FAD-dependent oxidoreductase [Actinomycetia bacterium]|nr:FAD-dependent oxidoreductase [bacterium]MCP4087875.1 FAD-dependent oxidoreductase [Actinomycetes bacterium]
MDRRQFLKTGALAATGAVYFGGAHLYLSDERWTPNQSYWVSRGRAPVNPPMEGDHSVDLAVIGGGVTGLSTAIHAREMMPNLRVALVEAEYVGYGATGRSGGILDNGTWVGARSGAEDTVGFTTGLIDRLGIACDLDRVNSELDPYKYAVGLKAAAEGAGVRVYEGTRVVDIDKGNPVQLAGDGFSLKAPRVIVATNGYMPKLGVAAERICPVHTGVAVTTPVPDEAASALLRVVANTESTVWGREVPGKRMLMGAGAEYYYDNGLYDSRHRDLLRALRRSMTSEYPDLASYPYEFTWSGPLGMTGDQEPVIGAEGRDDNILYCGGYTALGLAMGTRAGQWLAGMLEGVDPPDWLFRETFRFPGEPLRYIGVNGAVNLMNLGLWG